jgi:hypothetical protein
MAETGQFAVLWRGIAEKSKLDIDFIPGDWRRGADLEQIEARLAADTQHRIKAVMIVHNETSTGCVTRHPSARGPQSDRSRKTSGAVHGRYDFRPGFARIRARRLGHRCFGGRYAEGAGVATTTNITSLGTWPATMVGNTFTEISSTAPVEVMQFSSVP